VELLVFLPWNMHTACWRSVRKVCRPAYRACRHGRVLKKPRGRATQIPTIHEKESIKWIEGLMHLSALKSRCEHTQLVGIGDRESDVYEPFAAQRPHGVDWLVRAAGTAAPAILSALRV
jgi:hypothetical protein